MGAFVANHQTYSWQEALPFMVNGEAAAYLMGNFAVAPLREAGLTASNGEARRLIKAGGARVNDKKAVDEMAMVSKADLGSSGAIKLSAGKKRHVLVRPI